MAVELVVAPDRKETLADLLSRFDSADGWRKQWEDRATDWYKLYVGYREPLPPELQGRSNLHIPRTYEQIDTLRSRLVKAFFSTRPHIDFIPQPRTAADIAALAENERKAEIAAALVDQQLERNGIVRLWYDFVTSMLIFPCAIMSIGWRYERRPVRRRVVEPIVATNAAGLPVLGPDGLPVIAGIRLVEVTQPETIWDDNELQLVDWWDFWPDPRSRDLDSARFVFHRQWATKEELEDQLSMMERAGMEVAWPDFEQLRGAGEGLEEGRWERLSAVGISIDRDAMQDSGKPLFEVLHYWEDDRHAVVINRTHLAYDGPSIYWRHRSKPFVVASFEPMPNEFYGLSAVQLIEHLQHELNTTRNQRIDNVSLVLNRGWFVSRSADIDESELVSRPGMIIHVDNPQQDLQPIVTPDVTASSYNEEQIIKVDMENTIGTPSVIRGANAPRRETATEVVTKTSNASIRFDVKVMVYEAAIKRMARLMDLNNQQFIDQPRVVRLFGQEGANAWRLVQPGELIGEFDYRPAGASIDPAANKEVRRQQLLQLYTVALQTKNPYLDLFELTKAMLQTFDLRNPERFLVTPEKLQQQQLAQAMLLQALQAGGTGQQPAAPADMTQVMAQMMGGMPGGTPQG